MSGKANSSGANQLREQLADLCSAFELHELRDGGMAFATPFLFGDGDAYPIIFRQVDGQWTLTDDGESLGHWDYEPLSVTDAKRDQVSRAAQSIGARLEGRRIEYRLPQNFDIYDVAPFIALVASVAGVPAMEPAERTAERFATRGREAIQRRALQGVQRVENWAPPADPQKLYKADLWMSTSTAVTDGGVAAFFIATPNRAELANTSLLWWRDKKVTVNQLLVVKADAPISKSSRRRMAAVAGSKNVIEDDGDSDFALTRTELAERGVLIAA